MRKDATDISRIKLAATMILVRVDSSSIASFRYLWLVLAEKGFENANQASANKTAPQRRHTK